MATLPTKSDLNGNPTAGTFKAAIGQLFDCVSDNNSGTTNSSAHIARTDNPHNVTAAQVGAETPVGAQAKATAAQNAAIAWVDSNALVFRGLLPNPDWNSVITGGSYKIDPDYPASQTHSPITDLGLYTYGQLVVTVGSECIQQIYYTRTGQMAIRQSHNGGAAWNPWVQPLVVIAAGSGTGYRWRKYSNGDIEQEGTITFTASNTFYYNTFTFPIEFTSADYTITGNGSTTRSGASLTLGEGIDIVCFDAPTTTGGRYRIDTNTSATLSGTHTIHYRARGR